MKLQTRKSPLTLIVIGIAVLALAQAACSFASPLSGGFSQEVDIRLDDDLFNQATPSFRYGDVNFWEILDIDIDRMELHDGFVRLLGACRLPDGSAPDCSIDLSLAAQEDKLVAKVIGLEAAGIGLDDPRVVMINQEMVVNLSLQDVEAGSGILFKEVEVTEDCLRMKVQVNFRF
jgi:hypothetical protein